MKSFKGSLLLGVAWAVLALVLSSFAYDARVERVQDRREAKARADWPAQKAELERAVQAVEAPPAWSDEACTVKASPNTRCWVGRRPVPASYQGEVVAALKGAGLDQVTWECGTIPTPTSFPSDACYAWSLVGQNRVALGVSPRLDHAATRRLRKPTFDGVQIELGANLSPPY